MIITAYNFVDYYFYTEDVEKPIRTFGEVNTKPSMTVPGMTMGLREMIDRYVRGDDVEVFSGTYSDDDLIPDNYERMDEMERTDLARSMKEELTQTVEKVKGRTKQKMLELSSEGGTETDDLEKPEERFTIAQD